MWGGMRGMRGGVPRPPYRGVPGGFPGPHGAMPPMQRPPHGMGMPQ